MDNLMDEPQTPELNKMIKVREESRAVSEFLEWLDDQGVVLCERTGNKCNDLYAPLATSRVNLMAQFFELDLDVIEDERRSMLEHLRSGVDS